MSEEDDCLEVGDMITMCYVKDPNADKLIVVTGFEPSDKSAYSTSKSIVKELKKARIDGVNMQLVEIPFSYKAVHKALRDIWDGSPDLVIHLANNSEKNTISIKDRAFGDGYTQSDAFGFVPVNNKVRCDNEESVLESIEENDKIVKHLNEKFQGLKTEKSDNPGRCVEGYTFFLSMASCSCPVYLLQLPPIAEGCTKEVVTNAIREVIRVATSQ